MKLYVKQMYDWNYYAYYAEDVDEPYWDFFKNELWWQVGNSFIKPYDNVEGFEYCAENFAKYGETAVYQLLKILPAPWEKALDFLIPEMKALGVDWFVHGSAAMALWGIGVAPRDLNVIIPNAADYDKVRSRFFRLAIKPFERCDNWLMSALGSIFHEAVIGFAFQNAAPEPFDMNRLTRLDYHGEAVFVPGLESLRQDNAAMNRPDRVSMIEKRMREAARA